MNAVEAAHRWEVGDWGAAVFAGTDALEQIWAFIIFPLVGAALGMVAFRAIHPDD